MIQKLGLDADKFNACDSFEEEIMISIARLWFDHHSYSRFSWMNEREMWLGIILNTDDEMKDSTLKRNRWEIECKFFLRYT